MDLSRDDYVIAIRSAFLQKSNKQRFSLIGLIIFSIIFIILGRVNFPPIEYIKISIKEIVFRSSFIVSAPENFIKEKNKNIRSHFSLYKEHKNTKAELEELKSKILVNEFTINENVRLKKIINDYLVESDKIVAKVLIDKDSPFLRSLVVNKGSKDSVKLGMAVLDKAYLVGKVVEVNYVTSRVLLLSDLNSKIPVTIEPAGIQSILSGAGKEKGVIQYLKENYNIEDQSTVYTSGAGGLFKAGIPIGKMNLSKLINKKKALDFFSDFSQLRFVQIVSYEQENVLKADREAKIRIKKDEKIKAKEEAIKEARIKFEEEDRIKVEREARIKAQIKAQIKTKKVAQIESEKKPKEGVIFGKLKKKYKWKCKKTIFNRLYVEGTPEFKTCIVNKGPKKQKEKKN